MVEDQTTPKFRPVEDIQVGEIQESHRPARNRPKHQQQPSQDGERQERLQKNKIATNIKTHGPENEETFLKYLPVGKGGYDGDPNHAEILDYNNDVNTADDVANSVIEGDYTDDTTIKVDIISDTATHAQSPMQLGGPTRQRDGGTLTTNYQRQEQAQDRDPRFKNRPFDKRGSQALQVDIFPELRGVNPFSRIELLIQLQNNIVLNEFGLPNYLYKPDLLDFTLFQPDENVLPNTLMEYLAAAQIQLYYHEGFPSLLDGTPLWGKLPFEAAIDFHLFQQYLKLPGARQLAATPTTSGAHNISYLTSIYHLNYWKWRAAAHDALAIAHYQRQREQRILICEDTTFLRVEEAMDKLWSVFPDVNFGILAADPTAFVGVLDKLSKLQREVLGLQKGAQPQPQSQSVEVTMRRVTSDTAEANRMRDSKIGKSGLNDLSLLADPESAKTAQELILRLGQNHNR